jgi:hypothetical protein
MTEKLARGGRIQLGIIALVFFGPLIVATWMYMTGQLQPATGTNHGYLFQPVVSLVDEVPSSAVVREASGHWLLLYAEAGPCEQSCEEALYRSRQIRLMLGPEMDRVERVFLHGDAPPDTVLLEGEQRGLMTINDRGLATLLNEKRPRELQPGGLYLIDPLNNLVMYFSPALNPRDIVDDLKHLLELSRIG